MTATQQPALSVQDYIDIFRRRWKVMAFIVLVAVGAATVATLLLETTYRGRAEVLIRTPTSVQLFPSVDEGGSRLNRQPQTELIFLGTDGFREVAADTLGRTASVTTSLVSDSGVGGGSRIRFENVDEDPVLAAEAAQTYAEVYIAERHLSDLIDLQRQINATSDDLRIVEDELAAILVPIQEIDAAIDRATDPTELETLRTRRDQLFIQFGVDIGRLQADQAQFSDELERLVGARSALDDPSVNAVISRAATPPTTPDSSGWLQNLLVALALGTVIGVGVALLREALDGRAHSDAEIRRTLDTQILGHVGLLPKVRRNVSGLIVNQATPKREDLEAFRKIRSSILFARRTEPLDSLVVTSPSQGNGKTRVASNMAVAFAQQGESVLVIDADMRRPQIHEEFEVAGLEFGLSAVLSGIMDLPDAIRTDLKTGVHLLPSGQRPENPSELLGSPEMARVCKMARSEFDVVIIDSPPLLPVPDSRLVAASVDGVVLVVDPKKNDRSELEESRTLLEQAGANLVGVVVNRIRAKARGYAHAHGYAYE